ncbi:MAG TPA: hypothetical protein VMT72_05900, partial [Pseudolabrys sp.]|nr:hypothetical protein [Pseudolabrys sp.]
MITIGDCAAAGPARVSAAIDAAASINLRMFPPVISSERVDAFRSLHARCTITDKPTELPLPVRRVCADGFAALQNATFGPFGFP